MSLRHSYPSPCKPKPPKNNKKNVASTKNIASTSEKVSEVESEAEDDETFVGEVENTL
jgi:hypothetical protein